MAGLKIWRHADGFVARRATEGRARTGRHPEAGRDDPSDFWRVDLPGEKVEHLQCQQWSIDDELGTLVYVIEGGELRQIISRELFGDETKTEQEVVVGGLREIGADDAESTRLVEAALARHDAGEQASKVARAREGQARFAQIEGASEDFDAGDDFRRTQAFLRVRVESYDDPLTSDLLRALVTMGRLNRSPIARHSASFSAAMKLFALGCRMATFEPHTPTLERMDPESVVVPRNDAKWPDEELSQVRALAQRLEALGAQIDKEADGQADIDANLNAGALYNAANRLKAARRFLASLLSPTEGA